MPTNIEQLLGVFALVDYGGLADGATDDAPRILDMLNAAVRAGGGQCWLPPGRVVLVRSTVTLPANVELVIPTGATLRLAAGSNVDVVAAMAVAGVKITGGGTIDGNRAGQTAGTAHGIDFTTCTDALVDDVIVTGCRTNGIHLNGCTRVEVRGVTVTDCGTHGIALASSSRCVVTASASYDNSRIAAIGTGDGLSLSGTASDNAITGLAAYDAAGAGGRQGYGVREAAGMTGDRNVLGSIAGVANVLGAIATVGANSGIQPAPVSTREQTFRAVAAADAFGPADGTIGADATGGAFAVTLPTAVAITGTRYTLVRKNAGPNAVSLATTGGQTISGAAAPYALTSQGQSITVQSDGANWWIV